MAEKMILQRDWHLHFIVDKRFDVVIDGLDREDKIVRFNEISYKDYEYRCCFSNEFIHLSDKIHVAKGHMADVQDFGPKCCKDKMRFVGYLWKNGHFSDRFKCDICGKTKTVSNYYGRYRAT